MDDLRYEPEQVSTDSKAGLSIRWGDGQTTVLPLDEVRSACPCALCIDQRDNGQEVETPDGLDVVDAQLVGSYGIRFHWTDGHQAGIYAWEVLRNWG